MVAFANASGGSVYLVIDDSGKIKVIFVTSKIKVRDTGIVRNCDTSIFIDIVELKDIFMIEIREWVNNFVLVHRDILCEWVQISRRGVW